MYIFLIEFKFYSIKPFIRILGWRDKETGRKKREEYFLLFYYVVNIILLDCKNKNWDVGWVVKWVGKINKMVFEDVK